MAKNKSLETPIDFLVFDVDNETLDEVLSCEELTVTITLTDENYTEIVENIDGNPLLNCDAPDTYHSVYFWNYGEFPYVIKEVLKRIILVDEKRHVLMYIKNVTASVGQRVKFDHKNNHTVPDPNGDSCIWKLSFDLCRTAGETRKDKPKTFLLRWNPSISSFKLEDYKNLITHFPEGFGLNWSIYQWKDAHDGDNFYMMRVGDKHAGIIFRGWFTSEPYAGEDWAGEGKLRYYMDIDCNECSAPDDARIPLEKLTAAIPEIDWNHGHSGVLLTEEHAAKLDSLWES